MRRDSVRKKLVVVDQTYEPLQGQHLACSKVGAGLVKQPPAKNLRPACLAVMAVQIQHLARKCAQPRSGNL